MAARARRPGPCAAGCGVGLSPCVWMGRHPVHFSRSWPELAVCGTVCCNACLWLHLSHGILQLLFVHGRMPVVSRDFLGQRLANSGRGFATPHTGLARSSVRSGVGCRHRRLHCGRKQCSATASGPAYGARTSSPCNHSLHSHSSILLLLVSPAGVLYHGRKSDRAFRFEVRAAVCWPSFGMVDLAPYSHQALWLGTFFLSNPISTLAIERSRCTADP